MIAGNQRNWSSILGLNFNLFILLSVIMTMGFAEELWVRFFPKYLTSMGAALWAVGLFDAIKTSMGALYAYPGGIVSDRYGDRKALQLFTFVTVLGYGLIVFGTSWTTLIVSSFFFLAWSGFSLPVMFSMVGRSLAENQHARGLAVQATLKRVPVILGPLVGGILIDHFGLRGGTKIGAMIALILGIFTLGLEQKLPQSPAVHPGDPILTRLFSMKAFHPALRRLLYSDILVRFCERIPFAWVVIYCLDNIHVTATQFGLLTAVETLVSMLCLFPTAYLSDKYGREPFVTATFVLFTLFPLSLLYSHNFTMLVFAFMIRGLKEFGDSARKSQIIKFSPEQTRGQTVGAYYLIRDSVVTVGSFLGAYLWKIGPEANFLSAVVAGTIGTLYYVWSLKKAS
jgi:MFS family permease